MPEFDKDLQSIQEARLLIASALKAQAELAEMSQKDIDQIVEHMAKAAFANAEKLAMLAHEETGFGNVEDKIIKNKFASEKVYESIKNMKTVGILNDNEKQKVMEVAVPLGVIAGVIPSTNPTSTVIYKALIAIKARNAIVFSPHPGAKQCILETVKILNKAAIEAGAPAGAIGTLTILSMQGTSELMKHKDVALILATGGGAMVRAAYSSGNPAIGVGPGNGPAFIERTADIEKAVSRIISSKTFDNGVICASEQSVVVEQISESKVIQEFKRQGAYFLNEKESQLLSKFILRSNGTMNPKIVGKMAYSIAQMADITVPDNTTVLISRQTEVSKVNPYAREKLCPILAFYTENDWISACDRCIELLNVEGIGHTLCIHSSDEAVIREFALRKPVSRFLVNTPGALGGIGATTNLSPALTLGCGTVGGSSTSDNITPLNLLNIRRASYGIREKEDIRFTLNQDITFNGQNNIDLNSLNKEISKKEIAQLIEVALQKLAKEEA